MCRHKFLIYSAFLFLALSLAFRADARSVAVALNSSGGSVHDVLLVSDRVLGPYGFVRGESNSVNSLTPDHLTYYARHISAGNPTACDVYLSNGRMIFHFLETASPHSNNTTAQLCNQLAHAMIQRYNPASVEVQLQ